MLSRPENKTLEVSGTFREQITAIAEAYFDVKNAFVMDDLPTATAAL
jgi:Cu(I)/Ag(I) efflux system membrane fusion protein